MAKMIKIKEELLKKCTEVVGIKYETVTKIMASNRKALESETKSSAGDKHETGRAMLQLEMEKASAQLDAINEMKITLDKIDISNNSSIARLGSVVFTSKGNYFLSIAAGKIETTGKEFYAVSLSSPIGTFLLGAKVGDSINFNDNQFKIDQLY